LCDAVEVAVPNCLGGGYLILTLRSVISESRNPKKAQRTGHKTDMLFLPPPLSCLACSVSMPERRAQSSTLFRADHHSSLHCSQSAPCTRILQCLSTRPTRASTTTKEQVAGGELHPLPLAPVPPSRPLASAGTCPSQCYAVRHNHLYRLYCLTAVFSRYQPASR
jgi:hypothetical protein